MKKTTFRNYCEQNRNDARLSLSNCCHLS